jgi:hypothetical protein
MARREDNRDPTSPAGRSKNASFREAFFGWGESRHINGIHGAAPLSPPEIAKSDFDLPAGEVRWGLVLRIPELCA